MLLAHLQETVVKRPKTKRDLQKLIDISGSEGVEAHTAESVLITSSRVVLRNLVTPGRLPFKFEPNTSSIDIDLQLPTVTTYEGSGLDGLLLKFVSISGVKKGAGDTWASNRETHKNKLRTLKGIPNADTLKLYHTVGLKTFEGSGRYDHVYLDEVQGAESLKGLEGSRSLTIIGDCGELTFQHFPTTVDTLNIELFKVKAGLPWYVTIPKTCRIINALDAQNKPCFFELLEKGVPLELQRKIIKMQADGKGGRVDMLEAQADLIDAECPDKLLTI